ncbi:MAG: efflux RND transporter permease subunit [Candidatus Omnitrophica bacterium]|nr:efflux RND transporter permease subunit [Candidatus Omnitrophota bacterium]
MSFSENFIRKPIMTTLIMVVVTIFGIVAFFTLPISDLPVIDFPVILVTVAYPGASPETMASAVASPLENEFTEIQGLTSIISNNTEGQSQIILTFDLSRNVDLAAPDVQAAIARAQGNLPTDLPEPPSYQKVNPSDTPILYLMLTSDTLTTGQLYDLGNRTVGKRITMIDGVSQVQVWGAKTAVRIQVDPNKLSAFGIGLNDISNVLFTGTVLIPAGSLNGSTRAFSIEPQGQLFKARDYEDLIVAYRNNGPVRLRDVAKCIDSMDNDVVNPMLGRPGQKMRPGAVVIAVSRAAGSNTVELSKRVRETIDTLQAELPGSAKLEVFYDKSVSIVESVDDVKQTILIALFLVIAIIFLSLGRISDTIIPSITLPLSVIATFVVMYGLNFSLDQMSLMGLTLCIGFVVDDAIVVLENTVRLIEEGKKPMEAAVESARQITFTIISMTLSLSVIFIPLVFMGGVVGRIFREFAITVVVAILCSGIISLTLTPMMCARMLKAKGVGETGLQRAITAFMKGIIDRYGVMLKWTLNRPITTVIAWIICFSGTIVFFQALPKTFIPEGDSGSIFSMMQTPLGTSTKQMRQYQDKVNNVFQNDPNVDRFVTVTGLNAGADQSTGISYTVLKERNKRKPMPDVVNELRAKMSRIPDGQMFMMAIPALKVSAGGEATAQGEKYSYTLTGADRDELYKVSFKLQDEMKKLPGFLEIQNSIRLDLPQLNIKILRDRASTLGLTAADIENALLLAYAQGKVTTYKTDVDQYDVIVELDKNFQLRPESLSQVYIRSSYTNKLVPLSSVAKWDIGLGPQNVPHLNQLNSATLSFNLDPQVPIGNATKSLEGAAKKVLPPGVTGAFQGEAEQFEYAIASLGFLILVAIFIKYVILGILYESYVHPFTILTTLPVATFGGLVTLYIFGSELSLYAYVGIFMLLGIVAKNGIMMVDFANENLVKGNMNDFDAIYNACLVRFRPILMTGLAAIMGAMPIALGYGADGASRKPLGLIVVGGLIFSQVVTLFVTPGIFLYMQKFQERYLDRFELTRSDSARKTQKE